MIRPTHHRIDEPHAGSAREPAHDRQVRRILLATHDAHGVYAKLGFAALETPEHWMALYL